MPHQQFEFHCANGCGWYFRVRLDTEEERDIIVVCPKCQHEHQRYLHQGMITDTVAGRPSRHGRTQDTETVHKIEPPLAACSDKPMLAHLEAKGLLGALWARHGGR